MGFASRDPLDAKIEFYRQELASEQEFYWSRFSSQCALQAGLFVLATSKAITHEWPVYLLGFAITLIWFHIQWMSLKHVKRNKRVFHRLRRKRGWLYQHERGVVVGASRKRRCSIRGIWFLIKHCSPTKAGVIFPMLLAVSWLVLLIFCLNDSRVNVMPSTGIQYVGGSLPSGRGH